MKDKRNLSLVMDFYELTMSQCYFNDNKDKEVVFDLFYRKNPDDGGYCVFAGLEQVVDYVSNLHFEKEDIDYLRSLNQFSEEFLEYLSTIRFTGDIDRYGSIEPILKAIQRVTHLEMEIQGKTIIIKK